MRIIPNVAQCSKDILYIPVYAAAALGDVFVDVFAVYIKISTKREVVTMAARLTDEKKKKIIADYVTIGTYKGVARKYKISPTTVRKVVNGDPDTARKCTQKKEENTKDILAHMDSKKGEVCKFIDLYLDELMKPEHLEKATPSQLSTALGTVIDKFTMGARHSEDIEDLTPLKELLK